MSLRLLSQVPVLAGLSEALPPSRLRGTLDCYPRTITTQA